MSELNAIPVTWTLALRVWWSISWRAFCMLVALPLIISLGYGIITGTWKQEFGFHGAAAGAIMVLLIIVPSVLAIYIVLKKRFKTYRIVILSTQSTQAGE